MLNIKQIETIINSDRAAAAILYNVLMKSFELNDEQIKAIHECGGETAKIMEEAYPEKFKPVNVIDKKEIVQDLIGYSTNKKPKTYYYAKIHGKTFRGYRGRVFYGNLGKLRSALRDDIYFLVSMSNHILCSTSEQDEILNDFLNSKDIIIYQTKM